MKSISSAHDLISNMKAFFQTAGAKRSYVKEEPFRAELFSFEQMERFGKSLAKSHKLSRKPAKDHLLKRLADNEIVLHEVRKILTASIKQNNQITPAGEWLMDNFYLIEENIRNAKTHFPKDYSEELPQLENNESASHTRIYSIALQIISHSDGRINIESLSSFLKAYQTVTYLQLGELWAIPIMLRLALIENLRRVSTRIAVDRIDENLADYWAKTMVDTVEKNPKDLILVIADMSRSNPPISSAFISRLSHELRDKGHDFRSALNWIEQQLSENGLTIAELISAEVQKQAADQLSMSNSITSLRFLNTTDWRDFVEHQSIVEQILRQDKAGVYGMMDFATRDIYRHVVDKIAKQSGISEYEVAKIVIELAQQNTDETGNDERTSHVGYYLIGRGRTQTKKRARTRISVLQQIWKIIKKNNLRVYLACILFITFAISAYIIFKAHLETQNHWILLPIAFLSLIASSQLAISLVNFISTLLVTPNLLPRMDFSKSIPPECRTLVVVPAMISTIPEIENLVDALEVRFLANRNDNLHYGLLTDFIDASQEILPEDEALVNFARTKIEELNKKYKKEKNELFFLFHRPRYWNPNENVCMGYERKRGKLTELNSLLRGEAKDRFSCIVGDQSLFFQIKYVITLDADTQLPLGTAWKMIATMAHPLNRPWYDPEKKRVTKGYGILQPRVALSFPDTTSSLYTRMHANEAGIDPYTRASSDVYQDLFSEGSFIGKGIYDLDIFKKALDGRFAENAILSHDLLEGCYVRSGLLSDVLLFEKYPSTYQADIKRISRWVRGDWQIFTWFLPMVRNCKKQWHKNPISGLSRWKIFDNIRRSLVPMALTLLLLLDWLVLSSCLYWTVVVSLIILIPIIISSIWDTLHKSKDIVLMHHIDNSIRNIFSISIKTLFTLICLPYEAFINLSAILRTIWRMIARKKLLEWNTSASVEMVCPTTLVGSYYSMLIEPLLAIIVFFYIFFYFPEKIIIVTPILTLWFITPFITWWVSKPLKKQLFVLTHDEHIFLRKIARKTWSFFENFVSSQDNWLPLDNFQEQPVVQLAHRTSPTNIGLSLLSNLSASDFGYIFNEQFIDRTTKTLGTLEKLERYKGHFYNWYDTRTLMPLIPKYISTVDSGNLIGHLLILKQGLLAMPHKKIVDRKLFDGLSDTLSVFTDLLNEEHRHILDLFRNNLQVACDIDFSLLHEVEYYIDLLIKNFASISEQLNLETDSEAFWWKEALAKHLNNVNDHFEILRPLLLLTKIGDQFKDFVITDSAITLLSFLKIAKELETEVGRNASSQDKNAENEWFSLFTASLIKSINKAEKQITSFENLAQYCNELTEVEWNFLYDRSSNLLTVGYNVQEHQIDASFYDLLASEARLCAFIGIAQGKLPEDGWFALGRMLTNVHGHPVLLSWSGSMFEYLMPLLIMPTYDSTLLDQTYKSAINWQIDYGKQVGLPWGISESGFNLLTANINYHYRAFGVPGLGLKRGLEDDSVIAPYATALALMVSPKRATENLELLYKKGFEGKYGFYEAIDYTPSRLQRGQTHAIVYSYMAHHQGMSLLALAYLLLNKPMQKLFEAEAQFKAALLLLQERVPQVSAFHAHTTPILDIPYVAEDTEVRIIDTPNTTHPQVQLLSNGKYQLMITNAGGGYSRWKDLAINRWREDGTCDNWGTFCYIYDFKSKTYWSNTHQPTLKKGENYKVAFSHDRVDFHTSNNEIETHTEIIVSPQDDIEIRRLNISNKSDIRKIISITSYTEVVLTSVDSDIIQPTFSNLFVQTEIIPDQNAILCTRRPRSAEEISPWMFHLMNMNGKNAEEISYETDRMQFIGRGNTSANPDSMNNEGSLSGSHGSVLDPIAAIRYKISIDPNETVTIDLIMGITENKETCLEMMSKYQDKHHKDRAFELAHTHSQVILRHIGASAADVQLYNRLASSILFTNSAFRPDPTVLINNHRGQSGLWGYAISGDLPIALLKIEKPTGLHLAKQVIQAHSYWKMKGLAVDLVIWNEEHSTYRQLFQNDIQSLIPPELIDRPGGIFLRASDQISNEDRILFQTVARVNITDDGRTLADHIKRKHVNKVAVPYITPKQLYIPSLASVATPNDLIFFNGLGGFSNDGKEYVTILNQNNKTPVPWVNVIANANFGTVISESGTAYTWAENAHEFRLTPWHNDPICDGGGEAFYLRDEETGHFWTTTLLPAGGKSSYITRHGFGYSCFEHVEDGIYTEMIVFVDLEAAVKFNVIKIRNQSGKARKLSVTGYTEWVLGANRMKTAMYMNTEIDPSSGALFAKNPYSAEFATRVAFFDVDCLNKTFTADRAEFIGRNGTLRKPDAMSRVKLSGRLGLALDPCAAIQVPFELADGEEYEIIFRLGAGKDQTQATALAQNYRGAVLAIDSLEKVKNYWKHTIGALHIETPDIALNLITNGWLTYQTISSRLWGRSGFYQSSGAFGFRDQLQDVLSLLHTCPQFARDQILLCSSRQFKEGDVQHWWHPPMGRGVRTHCSDDFLWLPFITSLYILYTGDIEILNESAPFLEGRQLNSGEESYYDLPVQTGEPVKLYDHCVKAIKHGFNYGEHGLPLIGSGDWNDGYDKVGKDGKGESVWLAFFFYDILLRFSDIADQYKDPAFGKKCKEEAQLLKTNIDKSAWDGQWYKRAWFDDGTPLGASGNEECEIDSVAQSWAVISGAGEAAYNVKAMESAYTKLVQKETRIIQLLEPPFDKSGLDPGYIKGYVPGIRENGGQYTHAAVWMIIAFAKLRDNKRVWELLDMINPVNHGKTSGSIATYKVEPYVLAADVYAAQHGGRGGWTWYTGSAGWMYTLIVQYFLGLKQEGNQLKFIPCIPKEWESFKVHYRYKSTMYHITFIQKQVVGEMIVSIDGAELANKIVTLEDDGADHDVQIQLFSNPDEKKTLEN